MMNEEGILFLCEQKECQTTDHREVGEEWNVLHVCRCQLQRVINKGHRDGEQQQRYYACGTGHFKVRIEHAVHDDEWTHYFKENGCKDRRVWIWPPRHFVGQIRHRAIEMQEFVDAGEYEHT